MIALHGALSEFGAIFYRIGEQIPMMSAQGVCQSSHTIASGSR